MSTELQIHVGNGRIFLSSMCVSTMCVFSPACSLQVVAVFEKTHFFYVCCLMQVEETEEM